MKYTSIILLTILTVSGLAGQPKLPERAQKLQDSYLAAIDRATSPLTRTYLAELLKMKTEFTKAGDLQSALAIDEEIKRRTPDPATLDKDVGAHKRLRSFRKTEDFIAWLIPSTWTNTAGDRFEFTDAKVLKAVWGDGGKEGSAYPMSISAIGQIGFTYSGGDKAIIEVSEDLKTCKLGNRALFERQP